jgi:hypothetical protein
MTAAQSKDMPLIGSDLPWSNVEGEVFRVIDFTPVATVDQNGEVSAPRIPMPYGIIYR